MQMCVFVSVLSRFRSFEINGLCPVMNKNWLCYACTYLCRQVCHWGASFFEDVPLVSFFTFYLPSCQVRLSLGDSSLSCHVSFQALINSLGSCDLLVHCLNYR